MWRTISVLILGFWLVMTSLLVRYLWFPEGTHFAEVPPSVVLGRFLEQGSAVSTAATVLIFHRDERIGFANMRVSRDPDGSPNYILRLEGFPDKTYAKTADRKITWSVSLTLRNVDQLQKVSGWVRLEPDTPPTGPGVKLPKNPPRPTIDFLWKKGDRMPLIDARDWEGVNDQVIQAVITQALLNSGVSSTAPTPEGDSPPAVDPSILQVRARESVMDFAGQKSHGNLLEFIVMERWKARAFITEAGEFALMDLPEGYRLVEPLIHGLARDYDAEDEAEAALEKAKADAKKK